MLHTWADCEIVHQPIAKLIEKQAAKVSETAPTSSSAGPKALASAGISSDGTKLSGGKLVSYHHAGSGLKLIRKREPRAGSNR